MTDKKREIIFEAPPGALSPSVQALVDSAEKRMKEVEAAATDLLGKPLEIYFHVQNSRVRFSMPDLGESRVAIAKSLVKAVQEYEVKGTTKDPLTLPSSRLGEKVITYDRYVSIDWPKQTIFTNFSPDEGAIFYSALAIIVEELQGRVQLPKGEPT